MSEERKITNDVMMQDIYLMSLFEKRTLRDYIQLLLDGELNLFKETEKTKIERLERMVFELFRIIDDIVTYPLSAWDEETEKIYNITFENFAKQTKKLVEKRWLYVSPANMVDLYKKFDPDDKESGFVLNVVRKEATPKGKEISDQIIEHIKRDQIIKKAKEKYGGSWQDD